MNREAKLFLILAPLLVAIQFLVFGTLDFSLDVGLSLAHLFLIYVGLVFVRPMSNLRFALYLAGYGVIFWLVTGYQQKDLLLIPFAMLYAATFQSPLLFGYFIIFFVSYVLFPLYAFAEMAVGILVYTGIYTMFLARQGRFVSWSFVLGTVLIAFLLLPLAHLVAQSTFQDVAATWNSDLEVWQSIWRSLQTSSIATLLAAAFGIPLAYALARSEFPGKSVLLTLLDLPILIPQPVVALALLPFFGQKSSLGMWLEHTSGVRFYGAFAGIIAAQVFVSSPFLVRSAVAAFQEVDPRLENVARTLGAPAWRAFLLVSLPLASRGILAGLILAWCRSISEFGAVFILAPYPETAPVRIYKLFIDHGLGHQTLPAVILLLLTCLWIFVGLHLLRGFWGRGMGGRNLGREYPA